MKEVVIVDGLRTPFGKYRGIFKKIRPDDLAAFVLKELYRRNELQKHFVGEVILGCVNQAGEDNRNVARMSSLLAGIPVETSALTVNRLCGSGAEAINSAYLQIACGKEKVILAGGVESMTRSPYVLLKPENPFERGEHTLVDSTIGWRFPNPKLDAMYPIISLGEAAEVMADHFQIDRKSGDEYAFHSHRRAIAATEKGFFDNEILPMEVDYKIISKDEHIRHDINLENLNQLETLFKKNGTVTAGNSSGINDGACVLLIMEKDFALANGYIPLVEIVSIATAGVDPKLLGIGPVPSSKKAMNNIGAETKDISIWEISEAFASMTLSSVKELKLNLDFVNVNGGGISIGHPLGASGARMILNLTHEMKRRNVELGLSAMCIGVGQGIATVLKNI